jgi:tetratricopeptide (TPR) repeat protein
MMRWAIEGTVPTYVSEMYHHLGQIYGSQRKFKESIEAMEKAYKLEPDKHELLFDIATTYEEFNSNKTLALNYYRLYLNETDVDSKNVNYALDRITKIKEDLFFEE